MTHEELVAQVSHRMRASLAVIAGYSEIGFTRDDPELRAEARVAVTGAVAALTDSVDEALLALELAWQPPDRELGAIDLRAAAVEAAVGRGATFEPGEEVWALADHESVVRALQALLRAAGREGAVVTVASDGASATASVEAARPVALDEEELSLRNASRLAELQRGAVKVAGARLELELPLA